MISAVSSPIKEVGPVDRSRDNVNDCRCPTAETRTFRSSHDEVEEVGQPAGHKPKLSWDGSNLCIRQRLRDQENTDSDASKSVVQEPSYVVFWQPVDDWRLLDKILPSDRGKGTNGLATISHCPLKRDIGDERLSYTPGGLPEILHEGYSL